MLPDWRLIGGRGLAEIATLAAAAFSLILVARSVGPSVLGDYALATAISQAGFILVGLGTAAAGARRVAIEREDHGTWWSVVTIRLVPACLLAAVALGASAMAGGQWPGFGAAIAVSFVAYVIRSEWLLVGSGAVLAAAWSRVVSSLAMATVAVVIVNAPAPAGLLPWLVATPNVVYPLASTALAARRQAIGRAPAAARIRTEAMVLLRAARGFVVGDVSSYVYSGLDRILLYLIASPLAAGLYDAAYKLIQPFYVIATAATDAMFRPLAAMTGVPSRPTIVRYADLMLVATIPVGPFLTCFSGPIVTLAYGAAFVEASAILAVLGWVIVAGYLAGLLVLPMTAWGRPRIYAVATTSGAVGSVLGNLVLVPLLAGVGTAAAGVGAKLITGIAAYREFRRITGASLLSLSSPYVAASGLAAGVGATVQWLVSPWLGIASFAVVYVLAAPLLRSRIGRAAGRGPLGTGLDQTAVETNTHVTGRPTG